MFLSEQQMVTNTVTVPHSGRIRVAVLAGVAIAGTCILGLDYLTAETITVNGASGTNGTQLSPVGGAGQGATADVSGAPDSSNAGYAYGGGGGAAYGSYAGGNGGVAQALVSNGSGAYSSSKTVLTNAFASGGDSGPGIPDGSPGDANADSSAVNGLGAAAASATADGGNGDGSNSDLESSDQGRVSGGYASASASSRAGGGSASANAVAEGGTGTLGGWYPDGVIIDAASGAGGDAFASAVATATGVYSADASAEAIGGSGPSDGYTVENTPGPGGSGTLGRVFASSGSGAVSVSGTAIMGNAAPLYGYSAPPNTGQAPLSIDGGTIKLDNAVGGSTTGPMSLTQTATAGNGSYVGGTGSSGSYSAGNGGFAESDLIVSTNTSSSLSLTTNATGGAGGYAEYGTQGAGGGATSDAEATDSVGSASATSNANGGSAGLGGVPSGGYSTLATGGSALAKAVADGGDGTATASATAKGGAGEPSLAGQYGQGGVGQAIASATGTTSAYAIATAYGGPSGGYGAATASASVTGDASVGVIAASETIRVDDSSQPAVATAKLSVAGTIPTAASVSGTSLARYGTTSPLAGSVTSATTGSATVQSDFASPAHVLGMMTLGGGSPNSGTLDASRANTLSWSVSAPTVSSGDQLYLGLFNPFSVGSGTVTFTVIENGNNAISEDFASFSDASSWFTDNVKDLGTVAADTPISLDVTMTVDPTAAGSWFGASSIFGLSDPPGSGGGAWTVSSTRASPVPCPPSLWLILAIAPLSLVARKRKPASQTAAVKCAGPGWSVRGRRIVRRAQPTGSAAMVQHELRQDGGKLSED